MKIFYTDDFVKMNNPTPGERYRLDIVTDREKGLKLGGHFSILPAGAKLPYHYHEVRESLIFVIRGEATEIVEGQEFPTKAGDVIFISAGEKHKMENRTDSDAYFLEFFTPVKTDVVVVEQA